MRRTLWQDWVNLVLGIWLFLSPFFGIGPMEGFAAWNSYIAGLVVAVLAIAALGRPQKWEEWTNAAIGIWLIISPFLFGYANFEAAMWNHVIVGIIIAIGALWAVQRAEQQVA